MNPIDILVNRFEKEEITLAGLMTNATLTRVVIEYEPRKITISNLEEDLPSFIRLWRGTSKVEGSSDREKWLAFNEHESKELQIYRLLDPVSVLPQVRIERTIEAQPKVFLMDGSYRIETLELPPILTDHFIEEKNPLRWIRLQALGDRLFTMSQQDFPPYEDTITVIFRGPPPFFF